MTATNRRVTYLFSLLALALLPASASVQLSSCPQTRVRGSDQKVASFPGLEGELGRASRQAWSDSWSGNASDYGFPPKSTAPSPSGGSGSKPESWRGPSSSIRSRPSQRFMLTRRPSRVATAPFRALGRSRREARISSPTIRSPARSSFGTRSTEGVARILRAFRPPSFRSGCPMTGP